MRGWGWWSDLREREGGFGRERKVVEGGVVIVVVGMGGEREGRWLGFG
ncbi:uncharacterized protein G2W53_022319 [Senna tora]|uniref:Uncharacterized protein n=1 Tax=Senna tora TaxID=362788 RepID=A0A834TLS1_9FABA|nr:uncharacterized protein G2W53_022319 [Senna tora]